MEKLHLRYVLSSLPLPAFSFSSKKMEKLHCPSPQRFCNPSPQRFCNVQMEIFIEFFFIVVPARRSLVFIVHRNQLTGGHGSLVFS
ncbi:hypothetical protein MRB53_033944 [Persea americana]|uniref:Uncharacterized protein n=1 Tax=Persea americana TaxID=3435 RepID=A0ACC2KW35_PERAE|nr:hypothetical protein MRB53_033944 [Persea americana]